mmetsp:Transcript_20618/g.51948  ORF Transcript_20618/g.51948 Transcript_20618/m.51948 type:complete len:212 (-) Transcript_20618:118-753(-)
MRRVAARLQVLHAAPSQQRPAAGLHEEGVDAAVDAGRAGAVAGRQAVQLRQHAPVGDHNHAPAWMLPGNVIDGALGPARQVLHALPAARDSICIAAVQEGAPSGGLHEVRLALGEPLQHAQVPLPECLPSAQLQVKRCRDGLCRLDASAQIGGVQRLDGLADAPLGQRRAHLLRLLPPSVIQWRVQLPLQAMLRVPGRLAVPYEQHLHRAW